MTLRKPAHGGSGQGFTSLPYPTTPTSPLRSEAQSSRIVSPNGGASSRSRNDGPIGGRDGAQRIDGSLLHDQSIHPLSSGPQREKYDVDSNGISHSDAIPSSLQISKPLTTPNLSSESHRYTSSLSSDLSRDSGHSSPPDLARMRLESSNPFLRDLGHNQLSQVDQSTDTDKVNVWADESSLQNSIPNAERYPAIEHQISPPDQSEGYSPVCPTPFDEPCMGSMAATASNNHFQPNTGGGFEAEWASENPEPWSGKPGGISQQHPNKSMTEPKIAKLEALELQELEATQEDPRSPSIYGSGETQNNDSERAVSLPFPGSHHPDTLSSNLTQMQYGAQPASRPPQPRINTSVDAGNISPPKPRSEIEEKRSKKQRSETYQIRLVNWFDASSRKNPRRSPIMVQNANGPCPLLALVNALVLSTPAGLETALLDTLERREQVSLGLLLDAVIDELMSGRRGDVAQNLPDVSELYGFLINLHTGMNVNPRFITPEPQPLNLMDSPIHEPLPNSSISCSRFAGGFEDTREMQLYSTFAVPLIHGWIPPRTHPAFAALVRSAKSYEDAQNLMFSEEDLEDKLQRQGLTPSEQLLLEDIASIKYFLSSSATQLTGYGLDSITESLNAGQIAILFRNDHFSTLYRHPRSGQLFTLVTDMGYAGHDEVVWESLVDVSGEGCEFFAGDFRPVGNHQPQSSHAAPSDDAGWTTVTRPSGGARPRKPTSSDQTETAGRYGPQDVVPDISVLSLQDLDDNTRSPNTEQEDHDLALALQLQEEEEERDRQEVAARKRENELSQAFLESQPPATRGRNVKERAETRPSVPPRNSQQRPSGHRGAQGNPVTRTGETTTNTRSRPDRTDEGEDAPPPTYEQAAKGPAYHPPSSHPTYPNTVNYSPGGVPRPQGRHRQSSAYTQHSASLADSPITSSPVSPPFGNPPSLTSHSRRPGSFRNPTPSRGGLGGVEGAPGVYRRNECSGQTADDAAKRGDCTMM